LRIKIKSHYELPHSPRGDRKSEGFSGGFCQKLENRRSEIRNGGEGVKKTPLPTRKLTPPLWGSRRKRACLQAKFDAVGVKTIDNF